MSKRRPIGGRVTAAGTALERLTRCTLEGGFFLAAEGDRWVFAVLLRAQALGSRVGTAVAGIRGPRRRRARLRRVVHKEASRAGVAAATEELDAFADKVATLFDLVLGGQIHVDDIAFEQVDAPVYTYATAYDGAVYSPMEAPLGDA